MTKRNPLSWLLWIPWALLSLLNVAGAAVMCIFGWAVDKIEAVMEE